MPETGPSVPDLPGPGLMAEDMTPLAATIVRAVGSHPTIRSIRNLETVAGLPHGTVKQIVSGRSRNPRLDTLTAISGALGVSLDALIAGGVDAVARQGKHFSVDNIIPVKVLYVIRDAWFSELETIKEFNVYDVYIPRISVKSRAMRFGVEVKGSSMADVYPPGTVCVAVPLQSWSIPFETGDRVIVERWRAGLVEITCRELDVDNRGRSLRLLSRPAGGPARVVATIDTPDREAAVPNVVLVPEPKPDGLYVVAVIDGSWRPERALETD